MLRMSTPGALNGNAGFERCGEGALDLWIVRAYRKGLLPTVKGQKIMS